MNKTKSIIALVALFATLSAGAQTLVPAGTDLIKKAVTEAAPGDILELGDGIHLFTSAVRLKKDITIRAAKDAKPTLIINGAKPASYTMFLLSATCDVQLENLTFNATPTLENAYPATYAILVQGTEVNGASLKINNCSFSNFTYRNGSPVRCIYGSLLRLLDVRNSTFKNCDRGLNCVLYAPKGEITHTHAVERVNVYNCLFVECASYAIGFIALGDSPADVSLRVNHCVFDKCNLKPKTLNIAHRNIANIDVSNSIFCNQEGLAFRMLIDEHTISNCCVEAPLKIQGTTIGTAENIIKGSPKFIEGTYKLAEDSPLKGAATNGKDLGLVF